MSLLGQEKSQRKEELTCYTQKPKNFITMSVVVSSGALNITIEKLNET